MHFPCRPVDASLFDSAPMRFKNVIALDAAPSKVFAILADAPSWPRWFRAMRKVEWVGKKPFGVGATRKVWLTGISAEEHFFRWEQDRRLSFYLTGTSMPLAHAMAEDYLLEEIAPGKTRLTFLVAMEPRLNITIAGPVSRLYFDSMLKAACRGLETYVVGNRQ